MSPETTVTRKRNRMTEETFVRLKELADLEQTTKDIAKKLQLSIATVQRWRQYSMKEGMGHIKYYRRHEKNRPAYVRAVVGEFPSYKKLIKRRRATRKASVVDVTRNGTPPVAHTRQVEGITLGEYRILVTCPVCQGAGQVNAKLDLDSETKRTEVEVNANAHSD